VVALPVIPNTYPGAQNAAHSNRESVPPSSRSRGTSIFLKTTTRQDGVPKAAFDVEDKANLLDPGVIAQEIV